MDPSLLRQLMIDVSYCYHLAAQVGVQKIIQDPIKSLEVNTIGSKNVIKTASEFGIRTLITSSSEVYGRQSQMPLTEDTDRVFGPTNITRWSYSQAKALDEFYALELYKLQSFPVTVARLFNTVGPRQTGSYGMVLPRFISAALKNEPLVVHEDGVQTRSFCSVKDTVSAMNALINSKITIGQVYNIGSPSEISILDLAKLVLKLTNSGSKIIFRKNYDIFGGNFEEPKRRVPSIRKIKKDVNWDPEISLEEIIIDLTQFMRKNGI
jgi:UDP-glucose 4-epimerase